MTSIYPHGHYSEKKKDEGPCIVCGAYGGEHDPGCMGEDADPEDHVPTGYCVVCDLEGFHNEIVCRLCGGPLKQ